MKNNLHLIKLLSLILFYQSFSIGQDTLLKNVQVHTLSQKGTIKNTDLLIRGRYIHQIGKNLEANSNTLVVDGQNGVVTPGLISPISQVGLSEISITEATNDYMNHSSDLTASFSVAEAFNFSSTIIPVLRLEGITQVQIAPTSKHLLNGMGAMVSLSPFNQRIIAKDNTLFVDLGFHGGLKRGKNRALPSQLFQKYIEDALDYRRYKTQYEQRRRREYALDHADLEALLKVIDGEKYLVVSVDRESDIRSVLQLKRSYPKLKLIIMGGAEAWKLGDLLASFQIPVILNPLENLPLSFNKLSARLDNAALLHKSGVKITFVITGWGPHMDTKLRQLAGNAVANGLPWEEGLKAISKNPAEIYGISDAYGSIEEGKVADLVLWSGDPIDVVHYAKQVWIDGKAIPMQSRPSKLRNRYLTLEPKSPLPFAYQK